MKDLNDFIKRANRFKGNLHEYADTSMRLDNPSNNDMIDDINENYDVYETNMKDTPEEPITDNMENEKDDKEETC